jgi:hypothetical protein
MRRRTPLRLEVMEGRPLHSGLAYSLATGKSGYQAGDTISFTFSETNISTRPVTVTVAPADCSVTEGSEVIFQTNPNSSSQQGSSVTLQPGQAVTQTGSWSGTQNFLTSEVNVWGSFSVSDTNAPSVTTAFQIADPLVEGISTNQSVHEVGQPIEITSHAANTSRHPVTIVKFQSVPGSVAITQDGTRVWQGGTIGVVIEPLDPLPPYMVQTTTIQPGRSTSYSVTWDGVPSSTSSTVSTVTGSFVASLSGLPQLSTASFQIESPIKYTISVPPSTYLGEPGYQGGEPVPMTFTETNTSDQPVTVTLKPAEFQVSDEYPSAVVWQSPTSNLPSAVSP